jgi:hypothetical protein
VSVLDDDLLTADRPIPLGRAATPAASRPAEPAPDIAAAVPAGPAERCAPPEHAQGDRTPPAVGDEHPLAALRGFRFEVVDGGAAALAGQRPAVGRFLAAYLLVMAAVVALIAGFLLLAGAWRTTP